MYDTKPLEALDFHHSMLVDSERTDRFLQAIMETVKPGDIVLDLGSGTGILSCLACLAGAKHVYAIEKRPIINIAQQIIAANGLQDRVTFFKGWSTKIALPELADVLVTETIGNIGFEEGILHWVIDARKRHLKENARIIPQAVEMVAMPVEHEKAYWQVATWADNSLYAFDFSPLHRLAANNLSWMDLRPAMGLSAPAMIASADLRQTTETDIRGEAYFTITRDGLMHGLGGWFCAELTATVKISNAPPSETPSWSQMLFPLEHPLAVKTGDGIHLQIHTSHHAAHWHWQVTHYPQTAEDEEAHCTILPQQSTLAGKLG